MWQLSNKVGEIKISNFKIALSFFQFEIMEHWLLWIITDYQKTLCTVWSIADYLILIFPKHKSVAGIPIRYKGMITKPLPTQQIMKHEIRREELLLLCCSLFLNKPCLLVCRSFSYIVTFTLLTLWF